MLQADWKLQRHTMDEMLGTVQPLNPQRPVPLGDRSVRGRPNAPPDGTPAARRGGQRWWLRRTEDEEELPGVLPDVRLYLSSWKLGPSKSETSEDLRD